MTFAGFSQTKSNNTGKYSPTDSHSTTLKCTEVNEMTAVLQGSVLTAYTQGYAEQF